MLINNYLKLLLIKDQKDIKIKNKKILKIILKNKYLSDRIKKYCKIYFYRIDKKTKKYFFEIKYKNKFIISYFIKNSFSYYFEIDCYVLENIFKYSNNNNFNKNILINLINKKNINFKFIVRISESFVNFIITKKNKKLTINLYLLFYKLIRLFINEKKFIQMMD